MRKAGRWPVSEAGANLVLALCAGVGGALATLAFRALFELGLEWLHGTRGLVAAAQALPPLWRLLVPAAGGVLAGLVLGWTRRRDPAGVHLDYMEAVTLGDGRLPVRASLGRALSSLCSVLSGASLGREASMVQLAALSASGLGRWRRLSRQQQRLIVACGAAAGLSTAYNAPVAGALFVAEIVLRSVALESLGPLLVASATANLFARHFLGMAPLYHMPPIELRLGLEILPFAALGIAAGLAAPLFQRLLAAGKGAFALLPDPLWLRLGLGGLLVGALSLWQPAVWGNGYSVVNMLLQGDVLLPLVLGLLLAKLLATTAAIGSGAVGGIFTPMLFVGACLGALFGLGCEALWPGAVALPAWVAVGMGAFLAACSHAPLMAALMIFEMTGSPALLAPLLLVCVLAVAVRRAWGGASVYAASLPAVARQCLAADLLRSSPPVLGEGEAAARVEAVFAQARWPHAYVCDADGRFGGAVSLHDVAPWLRTAGASAPLPAALVRRDFPHLGPADELPAMLAEFARHPGERLPVLGEGRRLLGYVTKTDLMLALQEAQLA